MLSPINVRPIGEAAVEFTVSAPVELIVPVTSRPVEEKVPTLAAPVPSLRIRTDSESEVPTVSMTHRFTPLVRQPKEAFPFAEAVAAITPPPVPEPVPDSEPMMVSAAPVAVTVVNAPVLGVVAPIAVEFRPVVVNCPT
jgi:hypothetical protein